MKLNQEAATAIGARLQGLFTTYKNDRKEAEIQMMKNIRQHRSKYDPDVLERIKKLNRSTVYPGDTRVKDRGKVAKMMEMMFPAEGKNWEVKSTPLPTIAAADLDNIIRGLEDTAAAAAEESGQPLEITSDMIEDAVQKFADIRARNMDEECADQLSEITPTYPSLAKSALRSGTIYGWGVTKGPLVKFKEDRVWERNAVGIFEAATKRIPRPIYKPVSSWDIYPDLTSPSWLEQNAIFERKIFIRNGLLDLLKLEGFEKTILTDYLNDNPTGNYVEPNYAPELNLLNNIENVANKKERRYEVIIYRGFLSPDDLVGLGLTEEEEKGQADKLVDLWMIDDSIIKLDTTPFGDNPADFYHAYIHGEDEDSGLIGIGLPEDIRDSQLSICATARMQQDNAAAVAGPIFEVNDDLIAHGHEVSSIGAFTVIHREGQGQEAQYQAVRQLSTDSHLTELGALMKQHRETLDIESNLPAWTLGAAQPLGEAFRTTSNMSMMQGGASMVQKDDVRAFDIYVKSLIGSLVKWNTRFNKKVDIHGDFEAVAIGNASLVAKELRGAALDQFWLSLAPREKAMFDEYGVLRDRMESRDLPATHLKKRPAAEAAAAAVDEAASQAAAAEQGLTAAKTENVQADTSSKQAETKDRMEQLDPKVRKLFAEVNKLSADAKKSGDTTTLDSLQFLSDSIAGGGQPPVPAQAAPAPLAQPLGEFDVGQQPT